MTTLKDLKTDNGKTYNELLHIPLHAHIGEIRHHVSDNFEASVL